MKSLLLILAIAKNLSVGDTIRSEYIDSNLALITILFFFMIQLMSFVRVRDFSHLQAAIHINMMAMKRFESNETCTTAKPAKLID